SANLLNNYDQFKYDAPSKLPRVRTYVREYLTSSRLTMPVFQLTASRRLGNDLYGLLYGGMLESMYGGVGGEVLYRPLGDRRRRELGEAARLRPGLFVPQIPRRDRSRDRLFRPGLQGRHPGAQLRPLSCG